MREPQVDTFCRCVKKVKKTLKARTGSTSERGKKDRSAAEGRAIAICTKSVLQTKGRTIRKVRCRDKVLETQPMKGGVDDQKGGRFKWMGVDTPVFNNETVGEWNGFPVMLNLTEKKKEQFNGWLAKYNPVVRMVSKGDGELPVHELLRKMLIDTPPFNQPFVKMHFNLVVGLDAVYPVDYNATLEKVKLQGEDLKTQKLESVGGRFGKDKWFGLVTRTQRMDVADLNPELQRNAMCAFLRVLLRIDGRMIHADLHRRNMAVMFDGKPVIHDVGRMKIRDAADMPGAPRSRILRNDIYSRFVNPNYYMGLSQHFYIARMFKKIRKLYGERFDPPTEEHGWVQDYKKPSIESAKKFNTWLDSPATGGGGIETNYIQIARVYDILSVLKGLSDLPRFTAAGQPAQLTAYYYARKAAVTLTNHIFGGYATKENVGNIVRGFLALSGTMGECGGKPAAGEKPEDPEDRYAATYMPDDKFRDETRGNNAVVAAPPAPAPPAPAPPAPESVDLRAVGRAERTLRHQEDALNEARIESLPEGDDELSAIRAVTETPDKVVVAAAAAENDENEDIEVALEIRTEDKSAAAKAEFAARMEDAMLAQGSTPPAANPAKPARTQKKGKSIQSGDKNIGVVVMSPKKVEEEYDAAVAHATLEGVALPDAILEEKPVGAPAAPPAPAGVVGAPTTKVGGSLGGVGTNAVTFVARVEGEAETLSFLPPEAVIGTRQAAITMVNAAWAATRNPAKVGDNIIGYVSTDRDLNVKYETIRTSPYAGHAVLPISSYPCDFVGGVPPVDGPTDGPQYYDERDMTPEFKASRQKTVGEISKEADKQPLTCFILPKFEEKVEYLAINRAIPAVLDVLRGLCIERDFVITDLHDSNMALYNGKGVTFDYDRLVTKNTKGDPLENFIKRIKEEEEGSMNVMQNQHVVDTFRERRLGKMTFAMYFKIYDMLSVLSLLEVTCGLLPDAAQKAAASAAVASCVAVLKLKGDTQYNRESAVTELTNVLRPLKWPTTPLSSPLEAELKRRSVERRVAMVAKMRKDEAFWDVWQASPPSFGVKEGLRLTDKAEADKAEAEKLVAKAKAEWENAEAAIRALGPVPTDREKKALEMAKANHAARAAVAASAARAAAIRALHRDKFPRGPNSNPYGGRRTFRRKGLPQLL
jgi:hypothetical protein